MICPKSSECPYQLVDCNHSKPHKDTGLCCPLPEIRAYIKPSCPPCIPYNLQVGDRVRILGKTSKCSKERWQALNETSLKTGDIRTIDSLSLNSCKGCHEKLFGFRSDNDTKLFHASDLEYLPPESDNKTFSIDSLPPGTYCETISEPKPTPRYKWTGKPLTAQSFWKYGEHSCEMFTSQFILLCKYFDVQDFNEKLSESKLFNWAEKVPARIKWLIEKGFYEQIKPCPTCGHVKEG